MPRCPTPCRIPIQTCRSPWRRASCAVPGTQVLGVGFRPLPDWTPTRAWSFSVYPHTRGTRKYHAGARSRRCARHRRPSRPGPGARPRRAVSASGHEQKRANRWIEPVGAPKSADSSDLTRRAPAQHARAASLETMRTDRGRGTDLPRPASGVGPAPARRGSGSRVCPGGCARDRVWPSSPGPASQRPGGSDQRAGSQVSRNVVERARRETGTTGCLRRQRPRVARNTCWSPPMSPASPEESPQ